MKNGPDNNMQTVIRITALWAVSEAILGGMFHALHIPMSGIILAGFASISMTVLALSSPRKGVILRALIVVVAIKFLLSPHTSVMAYIAVTMQGLFGELIFLRRRHLKFSAFALTIFCLVYSAFQHLLVLTLLFGIRFWEASNMFLNKISQSFGVQDVDYIKWIVLLYIGSHLFSGIILGLFNTKIVGYITENRVPVYVLNAREMKTEAMKFRKKPKKKFRKFIKPVALFSLIFLLITYIPPFARILPVNKFFLIVLRVILITLIWMFLLSPLLKKGIKHFLEKRNVMQSSYFNHVFELIPEIQQIVLKSWRATRVNNRWKHLERFVTACFLLTFIYE